MAIRVSVVIPTYNRAASLPEAIGPLIADADVHEIVVVVDGSHDGSIELLRELAAGEPRLRPLWIENGREMAARAAGADHATGDVVLFLDDDVIANRGLASAHARHHERHQGRVVVGYMPVALPDQGHRTTDDVGKFLYSADYERRCAEYETRPEAILDGLWAGNFSLRREDAAQIGMNVSSIDSSYHRDRELGLRLGARGLTGIFDRTLEATHRYERPLDAFVRDAHGQGVGQAVIHQLHPSRAPLASIEPFSERVPPPARVLLGLARRPSLAGPLGSATRRAVTLLGRAKLWPLQEAAAKLLRLLEQQRGALEQLRRPY